MVGAALSGIGGGAATRNLSGHVFGIVVCLAVILIVERCSLTVKRWEDKERI
jgi:hypothetical protein